MARADMGAQEAAAAEAMLVEVAYVRPDRQFLLSLRVPAGTSLAEAVRLSGILQQCPEIDPATATFGVFSHIEKEPAKRILQPGDRVEIYRPLQIDPMEARKARAEKAKKKRAG